MNQRIRELAIKSGIKFMEFRVDDNVYNFDDVEVEDSDMLYKFAELIILESKCWIHKRIGPKTALDFLEHFGVEE